ncbi:uncharacterized protein N7483_002404 [Penicillium malachiteum]|uniref:uncharacterized protein n=1 Tax=Penicillium malachiteum TaxID=1324776 RepID=UPI002547BBAC|nr:uncharacterized protein N7483_002404 [Penicillium malachiteum]KAJ5737279.1 hypothetical protein N7483_002404 [Penicillium malachiteum]
MTTKIYHNGVNHGFQVGVINGNIQNLTIGQRESLDQACLRDLRTTNPYDDKERIKRTSGGLLRDSYYWIFDNEAFRKWQDNQSHRLLWIRGDPGKGKTMLLCGIIEELTRSHQENATICFFFCQATDMRINSATSVLRGLIYSLVEKHPSLLRHVRARYDSAGKHLFEDINAWSALVSIFTQILEDPSLKSIYLVIDALDECRDGLQDLLDLIVENSTTYQETRWAVSSRNEFQITEYLNSATQMAPISLELNEASVSEAVKAFIQYKVDSLAKEKRYHDKITATVKHHSLANSQGTFLWVALVWKNLDQTPQRHVMRKLEIFPPGLDALYRRMMDQVRDSEDAELCTQILGTVTAVFRPVTLSELSSLLAERNDGFNDLNTLFEIICICGSFLTLRESTVTFVHQSAKGFLNREVFTEIFPKGLDSEHHTIFSQCLNVLSKTLRRDIFGLKLAGTSTKDIRVPSPNPLAPAEYACVYWDKEIVESFLQRKYLHWLEALSILGRLSDGIYAMKRLERFILEETGSEGLLERAQDVIRFVQYHRIGIEGSPLQVYCSPLVFCPSKGLTQIAFQEDKPDWVLNYPRVEEDWSACLQTLESHSDEVRFIAWSPDGSRLASGSHDNTVRIWDPATGQSMSTLEGHRSYDHTVRIWDPVTGQSVSTFPTGLTRFVEFDIADSNCLHTDAGMFCISSVDAVTPVLNTFTHPPKQVRYGLRDDRSWITYGGLNLLWLPSEYRPLRVSLFATHENKMAFPFQAVSIRLPRVESITQVLGFLALFITAEHIQWKQSEPQLLSYSSLVLYDEVSSGNQQVKELSFFVRSTSIALEEVGKVFEEESRTTTSLVSENLIANANDVIFTCTEIFNKLGEMAQNGQKNTLNQLTFSIKSSRLRVLQNRLEQSKLDLQLMMQVIIYARLKAGPRCTFHEPGQRRIIKQLINEHVAVYKRDDLHGDRLTDSVSEHKPHCSSSSLNFALRNANDGPESPYRNDTAPSHSEEPQSHKNRPSKMSGSDQSEDQSCSETDRSPNPRVANISYWSALYLVCCPCLRREKAIRMEAKQNSISRANQPMSLCATQDLGLGSRQSIYSLGEAGISIDSVDEETADSELDRLLRHWTTIYDSPSVAIQ